jgi:ABC-type polysaccharide/polyol phosphate export permease
MPQVFVASKPFIESFELPWLIQIWRRSITYVLLFCHQVLPLFLVMAFVGRQPTPATLYVIPALAVVLVAGSGLGTLLALFGARYRDMQHAMGVASGFLFLFSPVMWRAEQLQTNQWAVQFNPLHYFIDLVRKPLLGEAPTTADWTWTVLSALVILMIGFGAFAYSRRRLYYWL